MNPDDLFKKMMHEAKVARGVEHPENDVPDDIKFPSKEEADELEARIREQLDLDDDVEISFRSFDMSDPEQAAEVEAIFREYHEHTDEEGDTMVRPGDDEAVDNLLDSVLGNDWQEAPEPVVGESFEDYMRRIGLGDIIADDDDDLGYDKAAPGDEEGPFDYPEVAGEGGFIEQLVEDQRRRAGVHGQNVRSDILSSAEVLVNGDRNAQYGDPKQDFARTAQMWGAYLGIELEPHDVAAMMGLLKLSRIRWSPEKKDHWVDLAGYAACGADCAEDENGGLV